MTVFLGKAWDFFPCLQKWLFYRPSENKDSVDVRPGLVLASRPQPASPEGSLDPVVARNSEVLSPNTGRVGCLSSRLCIYSAPNWWNAWSVQCCLWQWSHSIKVGHSPDFGLLSLLHSHLDILFHIRWIPYIINGCYRTSISIKAEIPCWLVHEVVILFHLMSLLYVGNFFKDNPFIQRCLHAA